MTLTDVTFTDARTISGRKVNVIMASSSKPSSPSEHASRAGYIEGLHQVITSESPVKKVSDIVIKPKVGNSECTIGA